jgi:DNA mismatch endonuclease Vsr
MTNVTQRPDFKDVSPERRRNMAANAGKNTGPEIVVRKVAHALGYRFRLHGKNLPGRPDIVFSGRRKIIEVRGCFWHRHAGCQAAAIPAKRREFWQAKFDDTVSRDKRNLAALRGAGWDVMVVWECEVKMPDLSARLQAFLSSSSCGRGSLKPQPRNSPGLSGGAQSQVSSVESSGSILPARGTG